MKKNISLDMLRIACAILVVFIHVSPSYSINNDGVLSLFLNPIFRVALPLFFMLSGYLIINKNISSIGGFYKKRLKSIILPFIIFSFIHYTFFHQWDTNPYSVDWFKNYLLSLLSGYPVNSGKEYFMTSLFWFVYTIIGLYLISPMVIKCLAFIDNSNVKMALIIILSIFAFQQFSPYILKQAGFSTDWFRSQKLNCFLVYFILGGLIARLNSIRKGVAYILIVLSYFIVVYQQYDSAHSGWFGSSWIDANVFMMILCSSILCIVHSVKLINDKPWVSYASSLTYGVYLIQIVTISIADRLTHSFKSDYAIYTFATGFVAVLIAFVISALVTPITKRL